MAFNDLDFLCFLAFKATLNNSINSSTVKLAKEFGISQQNISRKLKLLKAKELIEVNTSALGTQIKISEKGRKLLFNYFIELKKLFESNKPLIISGSIVKGAGEGAYYVSQKQYLKQFIEFFGFKPFFGTLNLIVDPMQLEFFLSQKKPIIVNGFKAKKRTFGNIKCFPVKILNFNYDCVLILPERSFHKEQAELIAKDNLRKKFSLKDNDLISIALR